MHLRHLGKGLFTEIQTSHWCPAPTPRPLCCEGCSLLFPPSLKLTPLTLVLFTDYTVSARIYIQNHTDKKCWDYNLVRNALKSTKFAVHDNS